MEYIVLAALLSSATAGFSEPEARALMAEFDEESRVLKSDVCYAEWNYDITLTDEAANKSEEANKRYNDYQVKMYSKLMKEDYTKIKDELLSRMYKMVSYLDEAALSKGDQAKLSQCIDKMLGIYNSAKVKKFETPGAPASLNIEDISALIANGTPEQKKFYWKEWHNTVGRPIKELFEEWIELENKTAILNGFKNNAERWQKDYETNNLEKTIQQLFCEMKPFFMELHAYIRYKLWVTYGKNSKIIDPKGPIPASLLGNLWGLDAINTYNLTCPYPNKPTLDASPQLQAQNYTGFKMAQAAEQFYISLGMKKMTDNFWKYSIFERNGRNMDCSPVAYNFFNACHCDYRIHFCTGKTQDDYGRMYHEMGHVVNYMLYARQPFFCQDSAHPAFGEAFGDLMYIFATSPNHLKRMKLIDESIRLDKELLINTIFASALADAFFWPYAYVLDLWRWRVMKGEIRPDSYNCEYWKLRIDLHGVSPPVDRDEEDFDPGAKWHIASGYQYMPYFLSGVVKYQFMQALCELAGQYDSNCCNSCKPLAFCDIYNSKAAGKKLRKMMSMGKTRPWPDALEALTGQRRLGTDALRQYYDPLYKWLQQENRRNNVTVGWTSGHIRLAFQQVQVAFYPPQTPVEVLATTKLSAPRR